MKKFKVEVSQIDMLYILTEEISEVTSRNPSDEEVKEKLEDIKDVLLEMSKPGVYKLEVNYEN